MSLIRALQVLTLSAFLAVSFGGAAEQPAQPEVDKLVILSSDSLQTQGMALVLATALEARGNSIHVLLCDQAGQLAIKDYQPDSLAPRDMTPKDLLMGLMKKGTAVQVCALFLPNSEYTEADLIDGVTVAKPPEIAGLMDQPETDVLTY
ncbi:hypothetical protein [Wenzhouxiangella sp. EGI_FJ10305]|uniref:hypothetical protein n=1 Tax=Wenzhouxiangella sp. EGI_FJ10305 TaxID=3243768 RepID=UPI0035E335DB